MNVGMIAKSHKLPRGWTVSTFDDLKSPNPYSLAGGPFGSDLTTADYVPSPGVPVIRGSNLGGKESFFIDQDFVFVSDEKADALSRNLAYPGDLIFTQRGTLGQVAEIPLDSRFPRYLVSQSQMKVTLDYEKADPRYVYHYFRSPPAIAQLNRRVQATGVPHINLQILRELPIVLAPLPEQRRIAAILDKANAIRRKRQQAIRLTETFLRSAFLDMFGDPATNPKGWPVIAFGDLGDCRLGKMLDSKRQTGLHARPYLRNTNVQWDRFDLNDLLEMDFDEKDRVEFRLRDGDVLICEGGEVGRAAVWRGELGECYFQKALHRLRPDPHTVVPEYVVNLLWFLAQRGGLADHVTSATIAHLTGVKLKAMGVPIPPLELQHRYANLVQSRHHLLDAETRAERGLGKLFDSLVASAFDGSMASGGEATTISGS